MTSPSEMPPARAPSATPAACSTAPGSMIATPETSWRITLAITRAASVKFRSTYETPAASVCMGATVTSWNTCKSVPKRTQTTRKRARTRHDRKPGAEPNTTGIVSLLQICNRNRSLSRAQPASTPFVSSNLASASAPARPACCTSSFTRDPIIGTSLVTSTVSYPRGFATSSALLAILLVHQSVIRNGPNRQSENALSCTVRRSLDDRSERIARQSYQIEFYLSGATSPFQSASLGKPAPDPDGLIRVDLSTIFLGWPMPGTSTRRPSRRSVPVEVPASAQSNPFVVLPRPAPTRSHH